jgi:16S rRNA (cytosine(967)-C(5))-methyltransferase
MMKTSTLFRQRHFLDIVRLFDLEKGPLDLFISLYFRHNPQLGSKDRLFIVEKIYAYFRWKGLIDVMLERMGVEGSARDAALFDLLDRDLPALSQQQEALPHERVSFPKELYQALSQTFGDRVDEVCRACNESAPLMLRANALKTTKHELVQLLAARGVEAVDDPSTPWAVRLRRRVNLFSLPEFRMGLFEVQDAGSQLVASCVNAFPGQLVLDYCAGSGGKSLCFAPGMKNQGQIFLHDVRQAALVEAKKRLRRAGVQNAQVVSHTDARRLALLKGRMDWVLVDAPCSGTGTIRRNPDMKWKFSNDMVKRLANEQRQIIGEAVTYLKPKGVLVYATCSLLKEENEEQVAYMVNSFPLAVVGQPFRSCPAPGSMDGFFAVSLRLEAEQRS